MCKVSHKKVERKVRVEKDAIPLKNYSKVVRGKHNVYSFALVILLWERLKIT